MEPGPAVVPHTHTAPNEDTTPDRAPRVLYVVLHREFSGAEAMHLPLIEDDPDPLVACPPDSRTAAVARHRDVPVAPIEFRELRVSAGVGEALKSVVRGLQSARELRRILRSHADRKVVFGTSMRPSLVASIASIGLRRRVLWCLADFTPSRSLRLAARVTARFRASRILPHSQAVADDFTGRSRRLRRITHVVHIGVDLARFPTTSSTENPVAAIVGHVSSTKRTDLAVDVAARVATEFPAFRLKIFGRAQFREEDFELERMLHARVAADPDLAKVVEFVGYSERLPEELAQCGLLLHCCPREPFGTVLIEAMAAGLPVVAPASGGLPEVVAHGETGFLYPPNAAEDAAAFVLRLLRDPAMRARMGDAARHRVEDHFSLARQLTQTRLALAEAGR